MFGTVLSPFGSQSSPFGAQATLPTSESTGFGRPALGGEIRGTGLENYTATTDVDWDSKLLSISAMPFYKEKCHEELRWEDYHLANKGRLCPMCQSAGGIHFNAFNTQSKPLNRLASFGLPSVNSFSFTTTSSSFSPQTSPICPSFLGVSHAPAFSSSSFITSSPANNFCTTSSCAPTFVTAAAPIFGTSSSLSTFGASNQPTCASPPSIFSSMSAPGAASGFCSGLSDVETQSCHGGTRVATYTASAAVNDYTRTQPHGELQSISAMPIYTENSHEELRWKDYQLGGKGGPSTAHHSASGSGFNTSAMWTNHFKPQITGFSYPGPGTLSNPAFSSSPFPFFTSSSGNSFGTTSLTATSVSMLTPAALGAKISRSPFGTSSLPACASSASVFGSTSSPFSIFTSSSGNPFGTTSSLTAASVSMLAPAALGANISPSPLGTSSLPACASSPFVFSSTSSPFPVSTFSSGNPFGTTSSLTATSVSTLTPAALGIHISPSPVRTSNLPSFASSRSVFGSTLSPFPLFTSSSGNPFGTSSLTATSVSMLTPAALLTNISPFPFGTSSNSPLFASSPSVFSSTSSPFPLFTSSSGNPSGTTSPLMAMSVSMLNPAAFGTNISSSPFGTPSSPACASSSPLLISTSTPGAASGFSSGLSFVNNCSSPISQTEQTNAISEQIFPSFGPTTFPSVSQPNMLSAASTGSGSGESLFSKTPSLLSTSNLAVSVQTIPSFNTHPAQIAPTAGAFSSSNWNQSSTGLSGSESVMEVPAQSPCNQVSAALSTVALQQLLITSPFTPPSTVPSPSVQYGIRSLPVLNESASNRTSSFLTSPHRRLVRIEHTNRIGGLKEPLLSKGGGTPGIPTANPLFTPRESPRAWFMCQEEQWTPRANAEKIASLVHPSGNTQGRKNSDENRADTGGLSPVNPSLKPNGSTSLQMGDSHVNANGHKANVLANIIEHEADIESQMPRLQRSGYYTEPQIQELAVKERGESGFCGRVKDFVVGRYGYGNIKFLGETDVRRLDLDSLVQFNDHEVTVYVEEGNKPPVGQGLNKPAVVTLLNIRCINKKTRKCYVDGPKVDRYRELLRKKAAEQGAEFLSYDPAKGEWKFMVHNFSQYKF